MDFYATLATPLSLSTKYGPYPASASDMVPTQDVVPTQDLYEAYSFETALTDSFPY